MPTKDEAAQELIDWHFQIEPGIVEVYRFITPDEERAQEPIKLLEVSEATFASGSVMTFTFGGTTDLPYPMQIATITPEEMQQVLAGTIPLPPGWQLGEAKHFAPPPRRRWRKTVPWRVSDGLGKRRLLTKRLPASRTALAAGVAGDSQAQSR